MSQKGETYTNLIKSEPSFFSYARCIFSHYGKKEKRFALSLLVSIFTSQLKLSGIVYAGVVLPVFLLAFQLLFMRKPKNPV